MFTINDLDREITFYWSKNNDFEGFEEWIISHASEVSDSSIDAQNLMAEVNFLLNKFLSKKN